MGRMSANEREFFFISNFHPVPGTSGVLWEEALLAERSRLLGALLRPERARMRGADWGELRVLRDLQKDVIRI